MGTRHVDVRPHRRAAHRQAPQAHLGRRGARPLAHPAPRAADAVVPLLRRPGRRRPALRSPWPAPRPSSTARSWSTGAAVTGFPRTPTAGSEGLTVARRRRATSRSPPTRSSTPPASGPTRCARSTSPTTPTPSGPPRASTSPCRGTRSATTSPRSIPVPGDQRSVFVVPWGDFTFVGTTDTDYDGPLDDPQCTPEDVAYLLDALERRDHRPSHATGRRRRHLGRAAAPRRRPRGRRVAPPTSPAATTCPAPPAGWSPSPAASSRPTARWRPTRSTRCSSTCSARRVLDGCSATAAPGGSGSGAPPATTSWWPRPTRSSPLGADVVRHLADRYGGEARTVLAMAERDPDLGRAPRAGPPLPAGRGGLRRPLRDGPHASTTCSAGAPGPACSPATTPRPRPPSVAELHRPRARLGRRTSSSGRSPSTARARRRGAGGPRPARGARSSRPSAPDERRPTDLPVEPGPGPTHPADRPARPGAGHRPAAAPGDARPRRRDARRAARRRPRRLGRPRPTGPRPAATGGRSP